MGKSCGTAVTRPRHCGGQDIELKGGESQNFKACSKQSKTKRGSDDIIYVKKAHKNKVNKIHSLRKFSKLFQSKNRRDKNLNLETSSLLRNPL